MKSKKTEKIELNAIKVKPVLDDLRTTMEDINQDIKGINEGLAKVKRVLNDDNGMLSYITNNKSNI
jgi:cell fate (sporulation/competence/biofilm development) regulator YmcA (YheA/YmcA/DUF963 family)